MPFAKLAVTAAVMSTVVGFSAEAREIIEVSGSSTVYPYAVMSADSFMEHHSFEYPNIESGGSSAGLKKFCEGVGPNTIDIANASRPIRDKEVKACADNGVTAIMEVRIGYDGLVLAGMAGGATYDFSPADWYLALGARIVVDGALVDNENTYWSEVNPAFDDVEIHAFIPSAKHGTREVFDEKLILTGCVETGAYEALLAENGGDEKAATKSCLTLREGTFAEEIQEGGKETLDRIRATKDSIGVLGLAFYEGNQSELQAATVLGVSASSDSIAAGEYLVSRPLFMYVKQAHLATVPGLKEYVMTVLSDEMSGPGGFLTIFGLVSDPDIAATRKQVESETLMSGNS